MISLGPKLRTAVLEYFYRNPGNRVHVRSLAATLEVDSTNLSRELRRLAQTEGVLKSEQEGRNLYYSINCEYPKLKTVLDLLEKVFGAREEAPGKRRRGRRD
jgi:DNA-binding MarR family transcriptional regulator